MNRRADLSRISFHRTRLRRQLESARPTDFFKMIWAADALITGREDSAKGMMSWPGSKKDFEFNGKHWFPRWELEHLLNEYLVVSPQNTHKRYLDCTQWASFIDCLNKYRRFSNAESVKDHEPAEITEALSRLFIPQMRWQAGWSNYRVLNRYWRIYLFEDSNEYFRAKSGISMVDAIKASFAAFAACQTHPAFLIDADYSALGIGAQTNEALSHCFGKNISEMRVFARKIRQGTTISDFKRSPIREFPIIRHNENDRKIGFLPIPELLLARASDGLYFDCVTDPNIRRLAGKAFEKYSFGLLDHFISSTHSISFEIEYANKKSPDILAFRRDDQQLALIVECKARRIPVDVLQSASPRRDYPDVYGDIVKGFVQIWGFVSDCRNNRVGAVHHALASNPRGVLLTLDPWLVVGKQITAMVRAEANRLADRSGISVENRVPVTVVSTQDWERCLSAFSLDRILQGIDAHCHKDYFGYMLDTTIENATGKGRDEITPFPWKESLHEHVPWFQNFDNS